MRIAPSSDQSASKWYFQYALFASIIPLCTGSREPHTEKTHAHYILYTHGCLCRSRIGVLRVRMRFFRGRIVAPVPIECQAEKMDDGHPSVWAGNRSGDQSLLQLAGLEHPYSCALNAGLQ